MWCLLDVDSGLSISLIQRRRLFAGFAAARRTMMKTLCAPYVCGAAYWMHIIIILLLLLLLLLYFSFFF